MTNQVIQVKGRVREIITKTQNYAVVIENRRYWAPQPVKYKVGEDVQFNAERKPLEGGAVIWEITEKKPTEEGGGNIGEEPGDSKPPAASSKGFQAAADIGVIDRIVSEGALIHGKCFEAIEGILGAPPQSEGDKAMVNSLFIWVTKELYFRGQGVC